METTPKIRRCQKHSKNWKNRRRCKRDYGCL